MNTRPESITPQQRRTIPDNISAIKESVGEIVAAEREHLGELVEQGKGKVLAARKSVDRYVQTNPMRSLLIAAGVGVAVGFLLGRRR